MIELTVFHWIVLLGFVICLIVCLYKTIKIINAGIPDDYAEALGKPGPAIKYSLTTAMSPKKKETAYLHLPTYTAGILYHIGTFLGFTCLILLFLNIELKNLMIYISSVIIGISGICGFLIFLKRILSSKMRSLSNPDDYISNILVTGFQLLIVLVLLTDGFYPVLFIFTTILLLYIPVGKLRHFIYFFSSRVHLGVFFGRRGVWPVNKKKIL